MHPGRGGKVKMGEEWEMGRGVEQKEKKRELVLPSGGLRGLYEMRCVGGVSPGPRGQVVSTA